MTGTRKLEWQSIDIPKPLFQTVRKLIVHTGDPSVAERVSPPIGGGCGCSARKLLPLPKYVRIAVRDRMNRDQAKLEADDFLH